MSDFLKNCEVFHSENAQVLCILKELQSSEGRNEKLRIIKKYESNSDFMRLLDYTFNTEYKYGIKYFRNTDFEDTDTQDDDSQINLVFDLLDRLLAGQKNSNKAIEDVYDTCRKIGNSYRNILESVLLGNLHLGIGLKSINQALGKDFIKHNEFPGVSLCNVYNEKTKDKINYPAIAQIKMDAARCKILVNEDEIKFFTRNGKEFFVNNSNLLKQIDYLSGKIREESIYACHWLDYYLDGEICFLDKNDNLDRKYSNGILNKIANGSLDGSEPELLDKVRFVAWDIINQTSTGKELTYNQRFDILRHFLGCHSVFAETLLTRCEYALVDNEEELLQYYEATQRRKLEGLVVKNKDAIWLPKRTHDQLKVKFGLFKISELIVTEVVVGRGAFKDTMGALKCESLCGKVQVSVGTGFSHAERAEIFGNADKYIGKVISVKHAGLITKRDSEISSLYLPVFVEIRSDKLPNEANTLLEIESGQ